MATAPAEAPPSRPSASPELAGTASVSQRIVEEAIAQNKFDALRNPDVSGLVLHASDPVPGRGDLTYIVNQRVLPVETTVRKRTGRRQIKLGLPPWPMEARQSRFDEFPRKEYEDHPAEEKVVVVDVNVYDDQGKLISKDYFDGSRIEPYNRTKNRQLLEKYPDGLGEFLLFLDSHRKDRAAHEDALGNVGETPGHHLRTRFGNSFLPREPIAGWGWGDKKPKSPAELDDKDRHDIPMSFEYKPGEDRFKKIFSYREQLGLPGESWYGLTMTKGGRLLQVTHDALLQPTYSPFDKGPASARLWEMTELRWNKTDKKYEPVKENKRFYKDAEMRELINGDGVTDIHWEIPHEIWRSMVRTPELGRMALKLIGVPGSLAESKVYGRDLSLDEAYELLASPDLYDKEGVRRRAAELKRKPRDDEDGRVAKLEAWRENRKIAVTLKNTIANYGIDVVNDLAIQLRNDYIRAARKIGLPVTDEKESLSWALRDIAEQRYYAYHRNEASPSRQTDRYGVEVGDPLGTRREARRKRREMIDYEIGLALVNDAEAVQAALVEEPYKHVDEDGEVTIKHRQVLTFRVNEELLSRVQAFARRGKEGEEGIDDILEAIAKHKNAARQPDRAMFVQVGRWLRRQVIQ